MQKCMALKCPRDGVAIVQVGLTLCARHALAWYMRRAAEAA